MGTSAGALAGSLYAAGYTPREVAQHLRAAPPIQLLKPCWEPWRGGVLSLDAVVERLAQLLPPTFEELQRDFAVGVVTADGEHVLIDSGPLPQAVAASAAIPFVFSSVDVPGRRSALRDGGVVDRIGLKAWRDRRRAQSARAPRGKPRPPPCLVHIIERSSPFSGSDDPAATGEDDVHVVRSPKSGVNFFDLGAFDEQFDLARRRGRALLEQLPRAQAAPPAPPARASASGGGGGGGRFASATPVAVPAALRSGGGGGGAAAVSGAGAGANLPPRPVIVARRGGGVVSGSAVRATPEEPGGGGAASGGGS